MYFLFEIEDLFPRIKWRKFIRQTFNETPVILHRRTFFLPVYSFSFDRIFTLVYWGEKQFLLNPEQLELLNIRCGFFEQDVSLPIHICIVCGWILIISSPNPSNNPNPHHPLLLPLSPAINSPCYPRDSLPTLPALALPSSTPSDQNLLPPSSITWKLIWCWRHTCSPHHPWDDVLQPSHGIASALLHKTSLNEVGWNNFCKGFISQSQAIIVMVFSMRAAFNINLYGHRLVIGLKGFRGLSRALLHDKSHRTTSPHRPHISHLLSTFTNPQIPYMTPWEDLLQRRAPDCLMSLRPGGLKTMVAGDGGNSP